VVLVLERNNAGLKKLSQVLSGQTSDSSAFLNVTCLLKYYHVLGATTDRIWIGNCIYRTLLQQKKSFTTSN
jgi:hypothetical protein